MKQDDNRRYDPAVDDDPYATDDPNVGEVHYGSPDEFHDKRRISGASALSRGVFVEIDDLDELDDADDPDDAKTPDERKKSAIKELSDMEKNALSGKHLRRRVQSKTRRAHRKPNAGVVLTLLVFALVVGVCAAYIMMRDRRAPGYGEPIDYGAASALVAEPPSAKQIAVPDGFKTVDEPSEAYREGALILVNYAYEYKFPEKSDTVSVFDYKTKSYKVRDTAVSLSKSVVRKFNRLMDDFQAATGCGDMLMVSGFRDYDFQKEIYIDRVQTDGEVEAAKYVALPGYSEHHTALAMDLSVYLSDGSTRYVEDYPLCDWFEEHAPEYGFILRYPSEKAATTHISFESWHYRYVGVPHAEIITERDMCLEDYIPFVRDFKCGEKYLAFRRGSSYESEEYPTDADYVIYSVPRAEGDVTTIPVPADARYDISGNNVDGFIVTASYKE